MVAENFAKLNKDSSLVVNGHHSVPPHPMARSGVQSFGDWSHQASDHPIWKQRVRWLVPENPKGFHGVTAPRQRGSIGGSTFTFEPLSNNLRVEISKNRGVDADGQELPDRSGNVPEAQRVAPYGKNVEDSF